MFVQRAFTKTAPRWTSQLRNKFLSMSSVRNEGDKPSPVIVGEISKKVSLLTANCMATSHRVTRVPSCQLDRYISNLYQNSNYPKCMQLALCPDRLTHLTVFLAR